MFGRSRKLKEARHHLNNLMLEVEKLKNKPVLISIERKGRSNVFTFVRGDKIHQIETMGLMSDNPANWRKLLLE